MKCDFCNLSTVVNFQKVWTSFTIDKNFDCLDTEEPVKENNIHLCEKHSEQWLYGKN